jgi:hypothetical protein
MFLNYFTYNSENVLRHRLLSMMLHQRTHPSTGTDEIIAVVVRTS